MPGSGSRLSERKRRQVVEMARTIKPDDAYPPELNALPGELLTA
jgi:hypothetical protein